MWQAFAQALDLRSDHSSSHLRVSHFTFLVPKHDAFVLQAKAESKHAKIDGILPYILYSDSSLYDYGSTKYFHSLCVRLAAGTVQDTRADACVGKLACLPELEAGDYGFVIPLSSSDQERYVSFLLCKIGISILQKVCQPAKSSSCLHAFVPTIQ